MTEKSKIELTIGGITLNAEGNQEWLTDLFDKVIEVAPSLPSKSVVPALGSSSESTNGSGSADVGGEFTLSLAAFLKTKGAESNQTKRFLATAGWLWKRGQRELSTTAVTNALKNNQQSRLGNPADMLNKNVAKGHCEKTANGFFITPEGWQELGEQP